MQHHYSSDFFVVHHLYIDEVFFVLRCSLGTLLNITRKILFKCKRSAVRRAVRLKMIDMLSVGIKYFDDERQNTASKNFIRNIFSYSVRIMRGLLFFMNIS